jgi:hypothetical protein
MILRRNIAEVFRTTWLQISMACTPADLIATYYFSTHGCIRFVSDGGAAFDDEPLAAAAFRALRSKKFADI